MDILVLFTGLPVLASFFWRMKVQAPLPESGSVTDLKDMNVNPADNSLAHLLWCILIALRTAEENTPFSSETARRRFLSDWMDMARKKPNFRPMASEFTALRELLEKTDKSTNVADTLNTLLEHAYAAEQCDFFRFRSALNTLLQLGWLLTVCRFPENITAELMDRRRGNRRHALQLTRTESAFHPIGNMVKPVTFQLLFSKKDEEQLDAETTFHNEGFQVVYARGELNLTKDRIIRTLHIGIPSLPEEEWNPQDRDIWHPDIIPGNQAYH